MPVRSAARKSQGRKRTPGLDPGTENVDLGRARGMAKRNENSAQKRSEELQQTMERLEEGVRDVFASGRYAEYLSVMSRFHDYSLNNCLLIAMQRPDATLVAGYRAWQEKFDRHVRKGEHVIRILCPIVVRAKPSEDESRDDAEPGNEPVPVRRIAGFRMATVFDVSQTEGKDLPTLGFDELRGDVEGFEAVMGAIGKASRYPIVYEDIEGGAKGYFSRAEPKHIAIQQGMSQAQTLKMAVHELAHSVMHDAEPGEKGPSLPDSGTREVQAESVAYVVSSWLGLDTSEYSFGYVASWSSGRDTSELRASLDEIRSASHGIIDVIERETSKLREPGGREHARDTEREQGRGSRRLAERVGAARAAFVEPRSHERTVGVGR